MSHGIFTQLLKCQTSSSGGDRRIGGDEDVLQPAALESVLVAFEQQNDVMRSDIVCMVRQTDNLEVLKSRRAFRVANGVIKLITIPLSTPRQTLAPVNVDFPKIINVQSLLHLQRLASGHHAPPSTDEVIPKENYPEPQWNS